MTVRSQPPLFSIVVPVRDGAATLDLCLQSIAASSFDDYELIVADDGSADTSPSIAKRHTATVLYAGGIGPAGARNLAAQQANGDYLVFLDADCTLQPHTLAKSAARLHSDPTIDALIGSYTDATPIPTFAAQYKNLLHHFTHHQNAGPVPTFWTGYGIMRRGLFETLGGLDSAKFPHPAIEDIELGYRATQAGACLVLDPDLQITHHKRWTLRSLISADIFARALPWSRLLATGADIPDTLNIRTDQRLSAGLALGLVIALLLRLRFVVSVAVAGLLLLNRRLYQLFWRKRGPWFAMRATVFHWIYFIYSAIVFVYVAAENYMKRNVK